MGILDDYREIKCPDGTTRQVLRRIKKVPEIFSAQFSDFEIKVKTNIKTLNDLANIDTDSTIKKETKAITERLNGLETMALQKYTAAYLAYSTNPCHNDKVLADAVKSINKSYDELLRLENHLNSLVWEEWSQKDVMVGISNVLPIRIKRKESEGSHIQRFDVKNYTKPKAKAKTKVKSKRESKKISRVLSEKKIRGLENFIVRAENPLK